MLAVHAYLLGMQVSGNDASSAYDYFALLQCHRYVLQLLRCACLQAAFAHTYSAGFRTAFKKL